MKFEGKVFVTLKETMQMGNVRLRLLGAAHTQWTENEKQSSQDGSQPEPTHYSADETYVDTAWLLSGSSSLAMTAGNYQFPFQFQLPPKTPSSYEGANGHIRYSLIATIDNFHCTANAVVTIVGVHDLNVDAKARHPVEWSDQSTLGCCCCEAGDVHLTVSFYLLMNNYLSIET